MITGFLSRFIHANNIAARRHVADFYIILSSGKTAFCYQLSQHVSHAIFIGINAYRVIYRYLFTCGIWKHSDDFLFRTRRVSALLRDSSESGR
jgi:hypothetical protein